MRVILLIQHIEIPVPLIRHLLSCVGAIYCVTMQIAFYSYHYMSLVVVPLVRGEIDAAIFAAAH